jgi:alkylated DNA repair dioxygenase AlkB
MYLGKLPWFVYGQVDQLMIQGHFKQKADQLIINEYLPGQGISRHVDCVPCFGDTVASLSLGSTCEMKFEHVSSGKSGSMILAPRSMLVLSGEARYDWMHSIPSRKEDTVEGYL